MRSIDVYARRGVWALPVWAVLLLYATFTHQPDYRTDFGAWSGYVTQGQFLFSHLVGSILGAAIGIVGFVALSVLLLERGAPRLAAWSLLCFVLGAVLTTAVFGIAAFAQPAIGRAFLAGQRQMPPFYDDVNGAPLLATAAVGVLSLTAGLILAGIAVIRTRLAPSAAGWALAVGGPVFAVLGVLLANVVQSVGAALLVVGTAWIAWSVGRERAGELQQPATA